MSSRNQATHEGNAIEHIQNMFLTPALTFSAWNPFLAAALKGNAQAHEGLGTIASEWQGFVANRIQEDIALMQRLTRCSSPNQILDAYTGFWHKAAEDYGKEITTMTKLMTGLTRNMVLAARSPTDESHTSGYLSERVAD